MKLLLPTLMLATCLSTNAVAEESPDGMAWLKKMSMASRQLNYSGTFVYQIGGRTEVSKVSHYVDAVGEYEKLETMDGPPRQIIRTKDVVQYFFPLDKIVKIEKRSARIFPPFVFPAQLKKLTEFYSIDKAGQDRISGFLAQALILKPKDALRYGHKFWVDTNSGLLVKAKRLSNDDDLSDQYTFTELIIGGKFDRKAFMLNYDKQGWRRDISSSQEAEVLHSEWVINGIPVGFQKIKEVTRILKGTSGSVTQFVYFDGLAAVSIFIEPLTTSTQLVPSVTQEGPFNVFIKYQGKYLVTVIGEVPAATVAMIGESVGQKRKE